jgi:hypothetical protein
MIDLIDLQTVAQLFDNMELVAKKMEEAFNQKDAEKFNLAKKEVLEMQKNIEGVLENGQ